MSDETDGAGASEDSAEETDEKSLFFGDESDTESSDDSESDSAKEAVDKSKPAASSDTAPILTAVVALVVIVVIAAGAYFILRPARTYDLTGAVVQTGQCGAGIPGLVVEMLDSSGKTLGKSPLTPKQTGSSCDLNFAMPLPKTGSYQLVAVIPPSVQQSVGGIARLTGPKYTFEQLTAKNFHLTLSASDFAGASSSGSPPPPSPPASGSGNSGSNGGGGGGNSGSGNGNG